MCMHAAAAHVCMCIWCKTISVPLSTSVFHAVRYVGPMCKKSDVSNSLPPQRAKKNQPPLPPGPPCYLLDGEEAINGREVEREYGDLT
jgi:hypothetical protein